VAPPTAAPTPFNSAALRAAVLASLGALIADVRTGAPASVRSLHENGFTFNLQDGSYVASGVYVASSPGGGAWSKAHTTINWQAMFQGVKAVADRKDVAALEQTRTFLQDTLPS
jgi:hypothetical protein